MKNIRKGKSIFAFILAQVIIDIAFSFLVWNVAHPLSSMYNSCDVSVYLFVSSLLFLPIYFALGFLSAKVFKLAYKKSIINTAVGGTIILTGLWIFLIVASNGNHSTVLLYSLLNTPAGWAYMPISNSAGYLNAANLFFTVFSPIAFALGIKIHRPRDSD